MTARSRERGSHAGRPRNHGLPFTVPGLSGRGTPGSLNGWPLGIRPTDPAGGPRRRGPAAGRPAGAPVPGTPGPVARSRPCPPPAGRRRPARRWRRLPPGGAGPRHRHRKPAERRPCCPRSSGRRRRSWSSLGVLGLGFADGFGGRRVRRRRRSRLPARLAEGHYAAAAALTNGAPTQVSAQLAAAYTDLNASNAFLSMAGVEQHGDTAVATFKATVDLAQAGQQWSYTGHFGLTSTERPVGRRLGAKPHQPAPRRG